MMLGFHADYEELVDLIELFKADNFGDYSIIKNPANTSNAQAAGRKVLAEISNSLPPDGNCLDDDLFEDGFLSVSVMLSTDEASALSQFVRRLTIVELEAILKNKQAAKESMNGLWVIKESLNRWGSNIDLPDLG
jgi:hypothetical protein